MWLALVAGCKAAPEPRRVEAPPAVVATSTAAETPRDREALAAFAARSDPAELARAIAIWEAELAGAPRDPELLVHLARAHHFAGERLALDGDEDAALVRFSLGVGYAERALSALEPGLEEAFAAKQDPTPALARLGAPSVPAAYWWAACLGRTALLRGLTTRLEVKDRIRAAMERILELDAAFAHGGADRVLGIWFAEIPTIAGKDLARSAAHFSAARGRAPAYLPTMVAEAAFLATEQQDRAAFERVLGEVLAAPDGDDPDVAPENRLAKALAKRLLAHLDDRF